MHRNLVLINGLIISGLYKYFQVRICKKYIWMDVEDLTVNRYPPIFIC